MKPGTWMQPFGSGRWAWIAVGSATAAVVAVVLHAWLGSRAAQQGLPPGVRDALARTGSSELCVTPHEDLRHPGWARDEQSRIASRNLPDPRSAGWFVRAIPWRATR